MAGMSGYLETQILSHVFGTASYTKPTVLAIALLTTPADDTMTGATLPEVDNTNAYSRQELNPLDANWNISSSQASNAMQINFPTATSSGWGTITDIAVVDSSTYGEGNVIVYGTLTSSKNVSAGDTLNIPIGGLVITLD